MKKINLEHELLENNRKLRERLAIAAPGNPVSEVKGLIEYGNVEDTKILNNLGINSLNMRLMEGYGNSVVMEKIEKATNHTVIHISNIQDLCLKYRLRLLQVKNYTGAIPTDIAVNIKELQRAKQISSEGKFKQFEEHQLQTEFYIMASSKMFKLEEREKVKEGISLAGRFRRFNNFLKMLAEDPILFYKQDDEHYVIVRKWGVDFSIFRRVLGLITQNQIKFLLTILTVSLLIGGLFIAKITNNNNFALLFYIIVDICICGISCSQIHENFYTENNWRSTTK